MKRIFTILIMCVFLSIISTEVKAQIIKGETFLGLNLSQIDGDQAYGYRRFGLHAGVGAIVPVYQKNNFNFDIALEIAFNQRGSHQRAQYNETDKGETGAYDVYMNYLEVPLLFYFSDKQLASLGIGASYGRLVGLREYEHGKRTDVDLNYTGEDKYNLNDFCVLADVKVRIYERLKFGVRFQYSMSKIRTRQFKLINGENGDLREQYNNCITARLIYIFNEDKTQYVDDTYEFKGDNPRIHQKAIDKKIKKLKKKQEKTAKSN